MANQRVSELDPITTPANDDLIYIVHLGISKKITVGSITGLATSGLPSFATNALALAGGLAPGDFYQDGGANTWTYLTFPLNSASWENNSYSTTAKTELNLASVFAVPAGVKAVLVRSLIHDSGSASRPDTYLLLSPVNLSVTGPYWNRVDGLPNDYLNEVLAIVPCNSSGNIYYQIDASGAGTMDVWMEIWGYMG